MEQMNRMNSRMDEMQDFVKTNIPTLTDNKKGKQVSFSDQLQSQAIINLGNQGTSSSQMHNLSHVQVDEEAVETALAISSPWSGKELLDPYKDHPLHQSSIDEETPTVVVEQDSSSEDAEERVRAEPNPDTYKPPVPYPQALSKPRAKVSESDDHLLEALQTVTITIPLLHFIKHIPSYAKFLKGIYTPHRSTKRIQLIENISSIMMNSLPIKKRDHRAPMITSEIGGMNFTRSLLDTEPSINILPKTVFDRHHVGELQPFLIELCLADGSIRKPHGIVEDVILRIEGFYFLVDFLVMDMKITKDLSLAPIILGRPFLATAKAVKDWGKGEVILKVGEHTVKVNINKLMKYPSQAFEDFGAIDLFADQDIETCIKEVMTINEEAKFKELPLDNSTEELKPLPSTLKYAFLDSQQAKLVIISSQLNKEQEERLLDVLRWNEQVISWTLIDFRGLDPSLCTHRIFLEDKSRPVKEAQRRLNPNVWEAVKEEILMWLNTEIIYPISDSQWVSLVHVVPKKAGVTVTVNDKGKEIQTRLLTKWRVCIDYRELNVTTKKDHFPLPFIDQILDRLACHSYFCFLDGYSSYN